MVKTTEGKASSPEEGRRCFSHGEVEVGALLSIQAAPRSLTLPGRAFRARYGFRGLEKGSNSAGLMMLEPSALTGDPAGCISPGSLHFWLGRSALTSSSLTSFFKAGITDAFPV